MLFANVILLLMGSVLLSASIAKHYQLLLGEKPTGRLYVLIQCSGWFLCLSSLSIFVKKMGFGIGFAAFFGSLTVTFFLVTMAYSIMFYFRSVKAETLTIKQGIHYSS